MSEYDSTHDTVEHIEVVQRYLEQIRVELNCRKDLHDRSKFESPEKEIFDRVTPRLKELTYGSDEYKEQLAEMGGALEHHYANNSHHPEHYAKGIAGMDLLDLVEMFCDWCAATERHDDGDILKSIAHNKDRFGYDDVLESIFDNTAKRCEMGRGSGG